MNATLERPAARFAPGETVRDRRGRTLFVFGREWGPDNRLIRIPGWVYEVCRPERTDCRRTVAEAELERNT